MVRLSAGPVLELSALAIRELAKVRSPAGEGFAQTRPSVVESHDECTTLARGPSSQIAGTG